MAVQTGSVDAFIAFASAVGAPALDVGQDVLANALNSTNTIQGTEIARTTNLDAVTAFATEQDQVALRVLSDVTNDVDSDAGDANITATLDLAGAGGSSSCILFFKSTTAPLDATKPMASQVRMLVLGLTPPSPTLTDDADQNNSDAAATDDPTSSSARHTTGLLPEQALENMYQYLHHGFNPLLRSYASRLASGGAAAAAHAAGGPDETDGTHMSTAEVQERSRELTLSLPVITKRLNELEYALQTHLQNIEVPDIRLTIDPLIATALGDSTTAVSSVQDLGIVDELDDKMLNRIQNGVNTWIKEIQLVTRLERDANSGNVSQEIQYWSALERALNVIQDQVDGPAVQTTLNVLKQSRRALATIVFETDTDLSAAHSRVQSTMQLMRQFPIDPLMSASSVEELTNALGNIFAHLKKLKTADEYPLLRAVKLIQVLSRDLSTQLVSILSAKKLMHMPFTDATTVLKDCQRLFEQWDSNSRQFRELVLSLAKRRGNERIVYRTQVDHRPLQDRLEDVRQFLSTHEKLRDVVSRVLPSVRARNNSRANTAVPVGDLAVSNVSSEEDTSTTSVREISDAFRLMLAVDPVDVTREGIVTWESAKRAYDRCIDRLESRIIERLTDRLGAAKTADEMFRVFSKFNALFFRPRIRGAIQQFQTRLIGTVERDIEALQDKFKRTYKNSEVARMSKVRDVPPVSGAIIWARQIERQLQLYLGRVETVLGKGWEQHVEGKRLKEAGQAFMRKLNTQQMFDGWMQSIQNVPSFEITGNIFRVEQRRGELMLRVNFDTQIVELFKEVRNLQWLGFRIKYTLKTISDEAKEKYPFAMSLTATLKTFNAVMRSLDDDSRSLLAGSVKHVQDTLEMSYNKSKGVNWDADRLQDYVRDLSNQVLGLQEKCFDANEKRAQAETCLLELRTCGYDRASLGDVLLRLQSFVDELNLASYSNLTRWVAKLGTRIDDLLKSRLESALRGWAVAFEHGGVAAGAGKQSTTSSSANTSNKEHDGESSESETAVTQVVLEPWVHEIVLRRQMLQLEPPLEASRAMWFASLHDCLATVTDLPRLKSSRYDDVLLSQDDDNGGNANAASGAGGGGEGAGKGERGVATYAHLLSRLDQDLLVRAYNLIEKVLGDVETYMTTWLRYQALWDLETADALAFLGQDLDRWISLLKEIQDARKTFDQSQQREQFGVIVVDYQQVQAQVNLRYDAWQKELLGKFVGIIGTSIREFHVDLVAQRVALEAAKLEGPTKQVVNAITLLQSTKGSAVQWHGKIQTVVDGEQLARKQRFSFPADWLWAANVEGEWNAFQQVLARKLELMEQHVPALQQRVTQEIKATGARLAEFTTEWEAARPTSGNVAPSDALHVLSAFSGRLSVLREEDERLSAAKAALGLGETRAGPLIGLSDEIGSLEEVWGMLGQVDTIVQQLRELPWNAVVPRKLRASLDGVLEQLREFPSRIRQYQAFVQVQERVRGYRKLNTLLAELKAEAVRDRHWREIVKVLGVNQRSNGSETCLGDIWDGRWNTAESQVRDVLRTAQGELALEEFLRQIREDWTVSEFELVNFQQRCKLIRGWDELFSKLDENMNSLFSMKNSPYFAIFEEEATAWESKLTRVRFLLDIWIDVQRRWVYLSGIFGGSADIQQQLVNEYARFKSIDAEFLSLMRRVTAKPLVLELVIMQGLERTLNRLSDLLEKIQRALGAYLERQRQSFSRFYFVGDEDLLELIGNSDEPLKAQRHMSKLFAGIAALGIERGQVGADGEVAVAIADADGTLVPATSITSMLSTQGEEVVFSEPVSLEGAPRINVWLAGVETAMRTSLAGLLRKALEFCGDGDKQDEDNDNNAFLTWIEGLPAQILLLAIQTHWSSRMETALRAGSGGSVADWVDGKLQLLTRRVLLNLSPYVRKKYEQMITEMVHLRNVSRGLSDVSTASALGGRDGDGPGSFNWLSQLRIVYDSKAALGSELSVNMANASFRYGYEYQGVGERLVQTPLTTRCYLTLTQALHFGLGGNPFGPAGTGKTESVKALGAHLGRFVLVFNCDENFDLKSMGRIFLGLCQVGAWGCFDEFNRLEERILSAVSQQILTIQQGLLKQQKEIQLIGENVRLNPNVGIFVTMNPGYAGRSNLPDNLKQLFRGVAMIQPDRELIGLVMLRSQGFTSADRLAEKVVMLFRLCADQLSDQPHYDFGLRAVKSVLQSAGNLRRVREECSNEEEHHAMEQSVVVQSACETIVPKLVAEDLGLFDTIVQGTFPGVKVPTGQYEPLRQIIQQVCAEEQFEAPARWVGKVLQLHQVQQLRHGVMLVGAPGTGKSSAWRVLLKAMERLGDEDEEGNVGGGGGGREGVHIKSQSYVIDPKALNKEELYGRLDSTTLEWTDGVFTHLLRKILANVRGEDKQRHWIVFDGDVDPEWAENLNSVLDDNRVLTLPNGERLRLPSNVRIIMEVQSLQYATLASVSRCGMLWFSEDTLQMVEIFQHKLRSMCVSGGGGGGAGGGGTNVEGLVEAVSPAQTRCISALQRFVGADGIVKKAVLCAETLQHVMATTRVQMVNSVFALLARGVSLVLEYNEGHPDFPKTGEQIDAWMGKWTLYSLLWGLGSSMYLAGRLELSAMLCRVSTVAVPSRLDASHGGGTSGGDALDLSTPSLLDYEVQINDGAWHLWKERVPAIDIEPHQVLDTDVIVPTVDTVRHADVLEGWLNSHVPVVLCGPPGSGKTMSLIAVVQSSGKYDMASLNFSSATTPSLILKTFEQYCEVRSTRRGAVMSPRVPNKWLVVFCDEINLPANDDYGTQTVITFMRQLVEQSGFWRAADNTWVHVERVQFVGACNPPTDAGRVVMSDRFLRHTPVLLVDYPAPESLIQIYGTFVRALLKVQPVMRAHTEPLTQAMVASYEVNRKHFTADQQPHYVYSPRELSRWTRALYKAVHTADGMKLEDLVRLWLHEGYRLFQDRLVTAEERQWCVQQLEEIAKAKFPGVDPACLQRPVLYSNWLTKDYMSVSKKDLRQHVENRLRVFYEEELNVPLVVFDDVLEHVLRIDRVLRQPLGHLLLVGESGAGKTVLTRFVAWAEGLKVFQIKLSHKYGLEDFDTDLRTIMKRAGCDGEKLCFIIDESNVLSSAFLERMNALLASGEVPGLFEGDEYNALLNACKDAYAAGSSTAKINGSIGANGDGGMLDSNEEIFRHFTRQVQNNLHVVFTMNPAASDLRNRAATSPALFNRCVVDWFGDWSRQALLQVGYEFTRTIDVDKNEFVASSDSESFMNQVRRLGLDDEELALMDAELNATSGGLSHRDAVVTCLVRAFEGVREMAKAPTRGGGVIDDSSDDVGEEAKIFLSPRDFLDLIRHFVNLFNEKRSELEDQQLHLNVGLDKLKDTADKVETLQASMSEKDAVLQVKNKEANAKLEQMVSDQNEAERKKGEAKTMGEELNIKNERVEVDRKTAEAELAEAEPALLSAQEAVQNIKTAHLNELRALNNPPGAVKMTLEAVCKMLGIQSDTWADIRKALQNKRFIADVVNFKSESLTDSQRASVLKMRENPDFVEEKVLHASKACHSLFNWVVSQLHFTTIIRKVQPLRLELEKLVLESEGLVEQHAQQMETIDRLEAAIKIYKEEYAVLIRQIETIKSEMESVKQRVDRSRALLGNLSSEHVRWEQARESFREQMDTLIGDVLLSASFVSFLGFFDHRQREQLVDQWRANLTLVGVKFNSALSFVEYLSRPSQRAQWRTNDLPSDRLCVENAIILNRFNRFPLVIDPSGQATSFLLKHYSHRKIVKTSSLDSSFMKQLESALRFGTCLLVEDVENVDPILNPVLNREIHRTGGRMLVRVGDQEIDFSPTFTLILTTRNATHQFPPDLCSRVTLVNFTVTPSSLESQCLTKILKSERPDVDHKRGEVLKLQGEYQVRLRELEETLLEAINAVEGNILDDDSVMSKLEMLKTEAAEVLDKQEKTGGVMADVEAVEASLRPTARMFAQTFFATQRMSQVHALYQFSLPFFMNVVDGVLTLGGAASEGEGGGDGLASKLSMLGEHFFRRVFGRVGHGLLQQDQLVFALLLLQIKSEGHKKPLNAAIVRTLLQDIPAADSADQVSIQEILPEVSLTPSQVGGLGGVLVHTKADPAFAKLSEHLSSEKEAWMKVMGMRDTTASSLLPTRTDLTADGNMSNTDAMLMQLIIVKAVRPELLPAALARVVDTSFLPSNNSSSAQLSSISFVESTEIDLARVVADETELRSAPFLLCSAPGFDPSAKVEALAARFPHVVLRSVAMGSRDVRAEADSAVSSAVKTGGWVLLKNVHLDREWLELLEKRLHTLTGANKDLRVFLTADVSAKLPSNLVRLSRSMLFEPPNGVRASLLRSLHAMSAARMDTSPPERARLYFLLAWVHAILFERLHYVPMGWSKAYEFCEADQLVALDTIDEWVEEACAGRPHIDPEQIPWVALRNLLGQTVYGGRIDNPFDQAALNAILDEVFVPRAFNEGFALVDTTSAAVGESDGVRIVVPEGTTRAHFLAWVEKLEHGDPTWMGLAPTAETMVLTRQGSNILTHWSMLQADTLTSSASTSSSSVATSSAPVSPSGSSGGASEVLIMLREWKEVLSISMSRDTKDTGGEDDEEHNGNPMLRCLVREASTATRVLGVVSADVLEMLRLCEDDEAKATYDVKVMLQTVSRGLTPRSWLKCLSNPSRQASTWVKDLATRCHQVKVLVNMSLSDVPKYVVEPGKLFFPAAFITATRQLAAQQHGVSIEQLELHMVEAGVQISSSSTDIEEGSVESGAFRVGGLWLEGGGWSVESDSAEASDVLRSNLGRCKLAWRQHKQQDESCVTLPVYDGIARAQLLFSVQTRSAPQLSEGYWRKRGASIVATTR